MSTTTALYDVLPLGVCIVDESLEVYGWNRTLELWTGIERHKIVGNRLPATFPNVASRGLQARLRSVFRDGVSLVLSAALHRYFLPCRLPSGEWMPQRTHVKPLEGDPSRAIVVLEDLSQPMAQLDDLRRERRRLAQSEASLRRQREELEETNRKLQQANRHAEQANRSKSEFLANMSHEIRTPLTAILGYSDIMVEDADPDIRQDAAVTIRRNGEHLLAIVNDILDLSKIEAGKLEVELEPCSLCGIAEQVLSLMQPRADAKGLALRWRRDAGAPDRVRLDATRLRQILMNLVGNAIKFTDRGHVELSLCVVESPGRRSVRFDVEDTGVGIADSQLQSIFAPFVQVDTTAQRRHGGTGLGLTICQRLASMLGGETSVTSRLGVGSTFSVTLPLLETTSAPSDMPRRAVAEDPPRAGADTPKPLAGRRLLMAEDGPDNQRLISYHLRKAGAQMTIVANGQQAVDRLLGDDAERFDLVLMDMQMPVMDGYTATKTLREGGYPGVIVALTAHAMDGDREKTLNAGCDDYATKPIDAPRLIAMISRHCGAAEAAAASC